LGCGGEEDFAVIQLDCGWCETASSIINFRSTPTESSYAPEVLHGERKKEKGHHAMKLRSSLITQSHVQTTCSNFGHQETNLRNSLITLSHTQTEWSGFSLETNTKFEQKNPHESEKGEKNHTHTHT
jgi:hypothetical protein